MYGTKDLVNQYAATLVASCELYAARHPSVFTFRMFLLEAWGTRVLAVFVEGERSAVSGPGVGMPLGGGSRAGSQDQG